MNLKGDELDDALMDDAVMMSYLQDAMATRDAEEVMVAAKIVVNARDHRHVTIRDFYRDAE
jgi:hypothetical protein